MAFFFKLILFLYFTPSCDELSIFHLYLAASLSSPLFSCQLIAFANSLDPVQYQQNVGSDLDTDEIKNKDEETSKSKKKKEKKNT